MAPYALQLWRKTMANRNSISKETPSAILVKNPVPCHQYDNWLIPRANSNRNAQFASTVLDISRGAKAIAGILAIHLTDLQAIQDGCATIKPLMSAGDTEALARLAVFSLGQLHEMAVNQVDHFNTANDEASK
jgi:hypothetical protein